MKTCAVADCGVSGGTRHDFDSDLEFCPFHWLWFTRRYEGSLALDRHARQRRNDRLSMAPLIVDRPGVPALPTWRVA
jgi:hypothetical protein